MILEYSALLVADVHSLCGNVSCVKLLWLKLSVWPVLWLSAYILNSFPVHDLLISHMQAPYCVFMYFPYGVHHIMIRGDTFPYQPALWAYFEYMV